MKRFGKLNIDEEKMKNTMKKKRKKLSRKQLIFSRVCKNIHVSMSDNVFEKVNINEKKYKCYMREKYP